MRQRRAHAAESEQQEEGDVARRGGWRGGRRGWVGARSLGAKTVGGGGVLGDWGGVGGGSVRGSGRAVCGGIWKGAGVVWGVAGIIGGVELDGMVGSRWDESGWLVVGWGNGCGAICKPDVSCLGR